MQGMAAPQIIEDLSQPAAYPFAVDRVEVLQTHVSILFFAGERVYKVKKAVDFGFLDFSTLERRRFFCGEEVRLNRRLAPDVYLGVVPILRGPDGRLRIGSNEPDPVDYAVEMRRLPADRMLDRLLDEGVIDNTVIDDIAEVLLRFHASAATGPDVDRHGEPDAVARMVLRNLRETEPFVGSTLSAAVHRRLERTSRAFLEGHRRLLEQRVAGGRIRDGHGDLHAGNICLTREGVVIYDCIEFDAALRCGDTARDLAFLVMDLDRRGFRAFGRSLGMRYADATDDGDFERLLPFYKTHLAAVRGKVASIRAADPALGDAARAEALREAMRYFHLAAAYHLRSVLILTCGLPGSGKSWTARELARPFGAAHLRSDVTRKRLAGVPPTAHPTGRRAEALYSRASSERTYETLLSEAGSWMEAGRSVVVDAVFGGPQERAPFVRLARDHGAPLVVVHLTPDDSVVAERLRSRGDQGDEVSDADWTVYLDLKTRFVPPREIPAACVVETPGTGETLAVVAEVVDRLLQQEAS